jgi:hypothetical protein
MGRWLRPLGLKPWDWKRCWKSFDFWLAIVILVLPLGPLLLLPLRAVRVRVRALRRGRPGLVTPRTS